MPDEIRRMTREGERERGAGKRRERARRRLSPVRVIVVVAVATDHPQLPRIIRAVFCDIPQNNLRPRFRVVRPPGGLSLSLFSRPLSAPRRFTLRGDSPSKINPRTFPRFSRPIPYARFSRRRRRPRFMSNKYRSRNLDLFRALVGKNCARVSSAAETRDESLSSSSPIDSYAARVQHRDEAIR